MRVLHVVNGEHLSGPERVVENLVASAREAEPQVLALFDGEFVRSSQLSVTTLRSRGHLDVSIVPRLARLLRDRRIDLVHAHTPRANLVGRLAARLTGRPVVSHVHSPTWAEGSGRITNRLRAGVDDATRGLSRRHIAVSPWLREQLIDRGYAEDCLDVCLNGVDVQAIANEVAKHRLTHARVSLGLPEQTPIIGMFAMFRERKGADVLIRAFGRSRARKDGATLLLVGGSYGGRETSYLDELMNLCAQLGLGESVRFTGFVSNVLPWMAASDIGVLPSLFGEGLPMALLEQMSAGLATIATSTPGIAEVVEHGSTGLLVPPGSIDELATAIDRLTTDGELRSAVGSTAATAAQRFDVARMVECVEATYRRTLGRGE